MFLTLVFLLIYGIWYVKSSIEVSEYLEPKKYWQLITTTQIMLVRKLVRNAIKIFIGII